MMLVVVLWVWGQGVQQLGTMAGLLNSVGRLTGLVSADLLLIQVLLISRIPWVERSFGQDELVRRHRLVGFTSFSLMVGHVVLITLAYAASDQIGVLAEVWSLVTTYPGMLLATAGTALLVMVVVTSVKAVRRRLRYESWHLLHLYAYLGVGLALPHQLWAGSDFTASPIASAYWWTVYLAAAGAVLVFRLGLPIWRNWTHRLVVDRVVPEGRGVVSIYLRGRNLHRLPAEAGQFFVWRFMHGAGWTRGNPFSLSAAPNSRLLRITAKDLGTGSRRLGTVPVGTRVVFEGPFGRLTDSVRRRRKMTMIASGIGITPLRALLEEADYRPGQASGTVPGPVLPRVSCSAGSSTRSPCTVACGWCTWRGRGCVTGILAPSALRREGGRKRLTQHRARHQRARRLHLWARQVDRGRDRVRAPGRGAGRAGPYRTVRLVNSQTKGH